MASLYIHIPFCKQRCIYCDFYFVTTRSPSGSFLHALKEEIVFWATRYGDAEPLDTIYFGGGTPSLLPVIDVQEILHCIQDHFETSQVREITFEINPDDAEQQYLSALRKTGVDRLSIGIQSFLDQDLTWMNRAHDAQQAHAVMQKARKSGFDNFSIDLIFGLPHQTLEDWQHNLGITAELEPPHISTYSLTIEPRTPLAKQINNGIEQQTPDDTLAQFYRYTMDFFVQAGYEHYEVSSFARPGWRAIHNQSYWTHNNYLGIGPSSHSFWKNAERHAVRWQNERSLKAYCSWPEKGKPPVTEEEIISLEQLADEYIMLRLRTGDGIDLNMLKNRYSRDLLSEKKVRLEQLVAMKLIKINENRHLSLTQDGMLICDTITGDLLT